MSDKSIYCSNGKFRWVWDSGSLSLHKGLVPFHAIRVLLAGLLITLFLKRFSLDPSDPYLLFPGSFLRHRFGRLHQEASDNMKIWQQCLSHTHPTHKHAHISITLEESYETHEARGKKEEQEERERKTSDNHLKRCDSWLFLTNYFFLAPGNFPRGKTFHTKVSKFQKNTFPSFISQDEVTHAELLKN